MEARSFEISVMATGDAEMITLNVKIEDGQVKAMLTQLKERTQNMKPAFNLIGQIVRNSVIKNFMEGGRPEKWKPSKRAMKEGGQTLADTGRLRNSIKSKAFTNRAEVGTNVIYAAIHQFGGKAGRGKKVTIPARPFLIVQDEDWTEINFALTDYLMRNLK